MLTFRALAIMIVVGLIGATSALQPAAGPQHLAEMAEMQSMSVDHGEDQGPGRHGRYMASPACLTVCIGPSHVAVLTTIESGLKYRMFDPARLGEPGVALVGTSPPDRPPRRA